MSVSQNGWPVIELGTDERLAIIPKIAGRVRKGDVEYIFKRLIEEFDTRVEDIDLGKDDWGFSNRNAYGSSQKSDHASGTAIDINATKHPIGRANTFSTKQVTAINKIVKSLKGAVVWGGIWTKRPDEMHFTIAVSEKKLASIVKSLKAASVPAQTSDPKIEKIQRRLRYAGYFTGAINGKKSTAYTAAIKKYQSSQKTPFKLIADGSWGSVTEAHFLWVQKLQTAMNKFGANTGAKLFVDGDHGQVTVLKVKSLQRKYKGGLYKGVIDGKAGPMFCKVIGIPTHP